MRLGCNVLEGTAAGEDRGLAGTGPVEEDNNPGEELGGNYIHRQIR
jgi:hypothetical protein